MVPPNMLLTAYRVIRSGDAQQYSDE